MLQQRIHPSLGVVAIKVNILLSRISFSEQIILNGTVPTWRATIERRMSSRSSRRRSDQKGPEVFTASSRAFTLRAPCCATDAFRKRKETASPRTEMIPKSNREFPDSRFEYSFGESRGAKSRDRGDECGWRGSAMILRTKRTKSCSREIERSTRENWPPAREAPSDIVQQWRESVADQPLNTRRIPIAMRAFYWGAREKIIPRRVTSRPPLLALSHMSLRALLLSSRRRS